MQSIYQAHVPVLVFQNSFSVFCFVAFVSVKSIIMKKMPFALQKNVIEFVLSILFSDARALTKFCTFLHYETDRLYAKQSFVTIIVFRKIF